MITFIILCFAIWNLIPDNHVKADNNDDSDANNKIHTIIPVGCIFPVITHRHTRDPCTYCRFGQDLYSQYQNCDVFSCTQQFCENCPEESCAGPRQTAAEGNKASMDYNFTPVIILMMIATVVNIFCIINGIFRTNRIQARQNQRRPNSVAHYACLTTGQNPDQRINNGLPTANSDCSSFVVELNPGLTNAHDSPPPYDECWNHPIDGNTTKQDQSCVTYLWSDHHQSLLKTSSNENQQRVNNDVRPTTSRDFSSHNTENILPDLNNEHELPPSYDECLHLFRT